jgi:Flp pilus assembly protein TadG
MNTRFQCFHWRAGALRRLWAHDRASQIVEFALSLPLLVLFVVGIFDFSGAISLKQKLTNAAREAARVAAADPANDLGNASGTPASVTDAFYVADNYLLSEKINDCGLSVTLPAPTQSALTWTYSASGSGCPGTGITVQVNRGCKSTITSGSNTIDLIETCVTITYPYKWQYSSVTGLLGITFIGPTSMTTTATAFNEN